MSVASRITRRGPLVPTILVIAALVAAFTIFAELWTQKLWFDSVAFPQVFSTQLLAQVLLFFVFFLVMGGVVGLNMWIAFRLRPTTRRTGQSAVLDRYRDLLESRVSLAILVPSIFFGLVAGISALSQSMEYLAWWNRTAVRRHRPLLRARRRLLRLRVPDLAGPAVVHPRRAVLRPGRRRRRALRRRRNRLRPGPGPRGARQRRPDPPLGAGRADAGGLRPAEPAGPLRLPAAPGHAVHRHAVHRRPRPADGASW